MRITIASHAFAHQHPPAPTTAPAAPRIQHTPQHAPLPAVYARETRAWRPTRTDSRSLSTDRSNERPIDPRRDSTQMPRVCAAIRARSRCDSMEHTLVCLCVVAIGHASRCAGAAAAAKATSMCRRVPTARRKFSNFWREIDSDKSCLVYADLNYSMSQEPEKKLNTFIACI